MQAIHTKYLGATNRRGSRIKATCQARSITLSWDHTLNPSANHTMAAKTLADIMGWRGRWVGGGLPDGSSAYCCVDGFSDEAFTCNSDGAAANAINQGSEGNAKIQSRHERN